jgi:hypothetical protein
MKSNSHNVYPKNFNQENVQSRAHAASSALRSRLTRDGNLNHFEEF